MIASADRFVSFQEFDFDSARIEKGCEMVVGGKLVRYLKPMDQTYS